MGEQRSVTERLRTDRSPWVRPLGFWLLAQACLPLAAGLFLGVLGWSMDDLGSRLWLFGTLGQALMDLTALGLLGVWRQRPGDAGYRPLAGALTGLALAALFAGLRWLALGHVMGGRFMGGVPAFTQAWDLGWPWALASLAALAAYGPGEALLVVTWIKAWDRIWDPRDRWLSPGVLLVAVLWALPHLMNLPLQGWAALTNTLVMVGAGLVVGVLYRSTGSAWGPVLFWTLANGTSL